MTKSEKASELFANNFNCSQAVLTAFAPDFGLDEKLALMLGTQFGGGARNAEMCGAVSGALMVLGLKFGNYHYNAPEEKASAYKIAEEFMNRFIEKNGTVVCRELLGYDVSKQEVMKTYNQLILRGFEPHVLAVRTLKSVLTLILFGINSGDTTIYSVFSVEV